MIRKIKRKRTPGRPCKNENVSITKKFLNRNQIVPVSKPDISHTEINNKPIVSAACTVIDTCDPVFTSDFINYFQARENEIIKDSAHLQKLNTEILQLRQREHAFIDIIEKIEGLQTQQNTMAKCNEGILRSLNSYGFNSSRIPRGFDMLTRNPSNCVTVLDQLYTSFGVHSCAFCNDRRNQDVIWECSNCKDSYFHLYCLDPPLKSSDSCCPSSLGNKLQECPKCRNHQATSNQADYSAAEDFKDLALRPNTLNRSLAKPIQKANGDETVEQNDIKREPSSSVIQTSPPYMNQESSMLVSVRRRGRKPKTARC